MKTNVDEIQRVYSMNVLFTATVSVVSQHADDACVIVSAAPASSASAESKQTDRPVQTDPSQSERSQSSRQVTKTVRLTEADTHHQTLTDVQRSAVGDVKTVSVAALTSSDLRSN